MMSDGGNGYSTCREVTVDESLPLLLSYPAREYAAMRQAPQVNLTGATQADAVTAVGASAHGAKQLDVELTYHFAAVAATAGDCVGVSLLGGGAAAAVIFLSPTVAVLNNGPCLRDGRPNTKGGFMFGLKANESFVSLRVLVDGNAVESFAQYGRAQVSFPGVLRDTGGAAGNITSWNTSVGLLCNASKAGTVDVGVWPLAFGGAPGGGEGRA
jgi:hypothetical protein